MQGYSTAKTLKTENLKEMRENHPLNTTLEKCSLLSPPFLKMGLRSFCSGR